MLYAGKHQVLAGSWQGNCIQIWTYIQLTGRLVLLNEIQDFPG
jgi:hypothetical protein